MKKEFTPKEREVIMDIVMLATEKLNRAYKLFTTGRTLSESEKRTAKQMFEAVQKASNIEF